MASSDPNHAQQSCLDLLFTVNLIQLLKHRLSIIRFSVAQEVLFKCFQESIWVISSSVKTLQILKGEYNP